jgi:hypothetical protein
LSIYAIVVFPRFAISDISAIMLGPLLQRTIRKLASVSRSEAERTAAGRYREPTLFGFHADRGD